MEWAVKECGFVNLQSKISSVIFLVFFLQKEYTSTYDYWHIAYCVSQKLYFMVLEFRRIDLKFSMIY